MNLGKLLGVGRSIFGGGETVAYNLNRRACLPKFNEGRNPFAPKTAEAALTTAATVAAAPKCEAKVAAPAAADPASKKPSPFVVKAAPQAAAKPVAQLAAQQAAQAAAKPARPGWTTRLNPFRPPEPVAPTVAARQAELSLDAVKVVHNDLADADVEVVPVKAHSEAPAPAVLPPARQAWEYMGERLLKSS